MSKKNVKYDKVSRRTFLRSASGFALSLPFLPSLLSEKAYAQAINETRFISATYGHGGLWNSTFYPSAVVEGNKLATTQIFGGSGSLPSHLMRHGNLNQFLSNIGGQNRLSAALPAALNPYLSQMNLIRGLDIDHYLGHQQGATLGNIHANSNGSKTGLTKMPTIDQIMAYTPGFYTNPPPFRSITNSGRISYTFLQPTSLTGEVTSQQTTAGTPYDMFRKLFGIGVSFRAEQKVVDRVLNEYRSLRNDPSLSQEDRDKIDRIMQEYSELESRVALQHNYASDTNFRNSIGYTDADLIDKHTYNISSQQERFDVARDFARVAAIAIKTNATKIITYDVNCYLNSVAGNNQHDWHGHAHDFANKQAELTSHAENFHIHFTAELLNSLSQVEYGSTTYLDNTLVNIMPESSMTHSSHNNHIITFGGASGRIHTGRYIDYSNREHGKIIHAEYGTVNGRRTALQNDNLNKSGILMNRWWVSLMQAVGLQPNDYEVVNRKGTLTGYGDYFGTDATRVNRDYNTANLDSALPRFLRGA